MSERVTQNGATPCRRSLCGDVSASRDAADSPPTLSDDVADDLGDVDIDEGGNPEDDDEGWETEDEMEAEAEVDDSELTFSKHSGQCNSPPVVGHLHLMEW